jgi:pyruvate/2-oxoglutarate/acetoin dehydrogenase E1 component
MAIVQFREALNQAMTEEMQRDESVFLMGEEVAEYDGAYKVSKGMLEKFGPQRVWDSPISENGFAGLGVGAAMAGLRPIIEMMTWNFGIQAMDQIINHAAKMLYMSAGQFPIPMVFRGPNGAAHMLGAQHSQFLEPMLTNVPGLKVIAPATPYDGKGLLKAAIRDDNPIIFLEREIMYAEKGEVPDEEYIVPIGEGDVKRVGSDVTLVTWSRMVGFCEKAAEILAGEGIDVEIIDPRTLQPLDEDMIFESVRKTHRAVVVEEAWGFASVGAEICDRIQRHCFDDLDAPVLRLSSKFTSMPYNEHMEEIVLPNVENIVSSVKEAMYLNK